MEQVLIKYPCGTECWMTKIETLEDFYEYSGLAEMDCSKFIHKVMTSNVPVSRWDHIWDKSPEGVMFSTMVSKCQALGGTPLIEYSKLFDQKMKSILKCLFDGSVVLINGVGGWMTLNNSYVVLDARPYEKPKPTSHIIKSDTKYINLENDPKLEEYTIKCLRDIDPNYSYVLNLRSYSKEDLKNVLEEFVNNGGNTVWQYTTGSDVQQMYEYSEVALSVGINDFVFEFNSGITEEIDTFILWLNERTSVTFK